jgi:hypothetical protein
MTERVLLMRLSCRTSSRGNEYLSGYLGAARVIAFKAKGPDNFGNEVWEVFVATPEERDQSRQPARREQPRTIDGDSREIPDDRWPP